MEERARDQDAEARADATRLRLERELRERRKELRALYTLSKLVAERGRSLEEVFSGVLRLIPESWQWPEITAARIRFDDRELRDPRFREWGPIQTSALETEGKVRGEIQVALVGTPPEPGPPFLAEERSLLDAIAERLGSVAAASERESELRRAEQRFRLAVDQFPYVFVIYDAERRIRFVNARGAEISRRPASEILGLRDEEVYPPHVVEQYLPSLEEALETRQPRHCDGLNRPGFAGGSIS